MLLALVRASRLSIVVRAMADDRHPATLRLIVFTDLDATLLDQTYSWEPARPALERLKDGGHWVVLSSSKTLAEMKALTQELGLDAPLIAENGATLAFPQRSDLLEPDEVGRASDGFVVTTQGIPRSEIINLSHRLRDEHNFQFYGFADWDYVEVMNRTGLSREGAEQSLKRFGTEPIVWEDTEARWTDFQRLLLASNIKAVRGGRFIHLMGDTDKARGLLDVSRRISFIPSFRNRQTIALGDSPNDEGMLSAADVAIVIPNPHHDEALNPSAKRVIRASEPGPIGWNIQINTLLDELETQ